MVARGRPINLHVEINRKISAPLWHQLSEAIGEQIRGGHVSAGERLESEKDLASRLGLSRPTVRHAMDVLVRQGMVVRKQGVGTQVLQPRHSRDVSELSLFEDLVRRGENPSTKLLEWTVGTTTNINCGPMVAGLLGPDDRVLRMSRLRMVDGMPLAILTNYMPERPALSPDEVLKVGLYASLRAIGVQPKVAHLTIGARALSALEGRLLDEQRRGTALTSERLVFDRSGHFVEYGSHVYRASQYNVELNLVG